MKDSLNDLLRERFQGHEAPVDPALWQVIEARLIAAGPATDPVNELFRERFQGHEADVDAAVWDGISQQLGQPAGSASGGVGQWGWWAAGIGAVAITTAALLLGGPVAQEPTAQAEAAPGVEVSQEQQNPTEPLQPSAVEPTASGYEARLMGEGTRPAVGAQARRDMKQAIAVDAAQVAEEQAITDTEEEPAVVEGIIERITVQAMKEARQDAAPAAAVPAPNAQQTEEPHPAAPSAALPTPAPAEDVLFLPNAFTPNGDGVNDSYQIVPRSGTAFSSALVRVYSMKTNQLVFSSSSIAEAWTGAGCEDGMYLVAVEAITLDGRVVSEGRVVWLNRSSMN
jgi:hypothetical protein